MALVRTQRAASLQGPWGFEKIIRAFTPADPFDKLRVRRGCPKKADYTNARSNTSSKKSAPIGSTFPVRINETGKGSLNPIINKRRPKVRRFILLPEFTTGEHFFFFRNFQKPDLSGSPRNVEQNRFRDSLNNWHSLLKNT